MSFKLKLGEEVLASKEMVSESSLSKMVEDLIFELDNGGPIMMYS